MSLDRLIEQIRGRSEADLAAIRAKRAAEEQRLTTERDRALEQIRTESGRATDSEIARERAQRLAAAKLDARKKVYEAREKRLKESLDATRDLLEEYAGSDAYNATLKRMYDAATDVLGKQVRVSGRAEDAARLSKVAGKAFDPAPRPILGGLIAESADGKRQLNLSLDELLRLREPRVREILA
jgi:vacuolar-type H+-ATPase subunit E/Vma4